MAVLLMVIVGISVAFAQTTKPQHARLSLISEQASLISGSQWIGLRFQLDPGWHIYWTNPGDSGEPPKITWHLPAGIKAGDLQFPTPHRIQDHGLTDFGYESEVVLLSKLTTAAGSASNRAEIGADVRYLICREVCVPARDHVSLTFPAGKRDGASAAIRNAESQLPQALPSRTRIRVVAQPDSLVLTVGKPSGIGRITDFIPADPQTIENSAKPVVQESAKVSRVQLKKSDQLNHEIPNLRGLLIAGAKSYEVSLPLAHAKALRKRGFSTRIRTIWLNK
jgi:DsbC/DsbD-like thiol-disulfide interchange protein